MLRTEVEDGATVSGVSSRRVNLLIMFCLVLALIWMVTLYLLVRARQQLTALKIGVEQEEEARKTTERAAFKKLGRACRANDPARARAALIAWAKAFRPAAGILSGLDLAKLYPDSGLVSLVATLDNTLYNQSSEAGEWQGRKLLEAAAGVRKAGPENKEKKSPLNPLYR